MSKIYIVFEYIYGSVATNSVKAFVSPQKAEEFMKSLPKKNYCDYDIESIELDMGMTDEEFESDKYA
jgi:hypothetical protein